MQNNYFRAHQQSSSISSLNVVVISIFRALIAGGGAPEIECSVQLMKYAKTLTGKEAYCFKAFAEALEIIPYTLAENAGLSPISVVTDLRNKHANGDTQAGINVRKVRF